MHTKALPGRPDLVLPRWNAVVFVNGCFWHCHAGCPYFRLPKTRAAFWGTKLARNRARDGAAVSRLVDAGWRVAVVWECAVRANPELVGKRLASWLERSRGSVEVVGIAGAVKAKQLAGLAH